MRLNRKELRKIQYDFNSYSNRLLQANYEDYTGVLRKFLRYIETTPIIDDYIKGCGQSNLKAENEVNKVTTSYRGYTFPLGDTDEEEVCNVYEILRYLVDTNNSVYRGIAAAYSLAKSYQDRIKEFNERFVMVLIRHVECYLTKVGIDMGVDEKNVYNVTVQNGQAIIANDNSTVTATAHIEMNENELEKLLSGVRAASNTLASDEDKEAVSESLEVIEAEVVAEKPKKSMLRTALTSLQTIKGAVEFGSAVASLVQFIQPML